MEHEGQTFHDEVEVPGEHSVHLALSMPTAIDNRSTHLDLCITIEPLLAQHGDERGEEGSGQTRVKDGLNVNNGRIGAIPFRELGIVTSWDIPKRDTSRDLEEFVTKFLVIRFELCLNVNDEGGCDCGEQAGLCSRKTNQRHNLGGCGENTHEDQRGVQIFVVFLNKVTVVFVGFAFELVIKFIAGVVGRSKEVWKEGGQRFEHGIL